MTSLTFETPIDLSKGNRARTNRAPVVAILATDTDFHDRLLEHFPHFPQAGDMSSERTSSETSRENPTPPSRSAASSSAHVLLG